MEKKIIFSDLVPAPIGPYSQAVQIGQTLYCSGQIALDKDGKMHHESIETETTQVMKNIGLLLKAADMDYENIVKTSIFLSDMSNFSQVNSIYSSYFKSDFPARETVQVAALPKEARVEITVIAVK